MKYGRFDLYEAGYCIFFFNFKCNTLESLCFKNFYHRSKPTIFYAFTGILST
jgi:hypothetical protein